MATKEKQQLPATVSEGDANTLANILITGDLSKLDQKQQWSYYAALCERLEIDPYTRPFQLLNLKGKLTMYATKACTEQLASTRNLTVDPYDVQLIDGLAIVKAKALKPTGQYATASGVVSVENLKGEDKANAVMKAETKACRRAVLRLCGLGMLDETETTEPDLCVARLEPTGRYSVSDATEYGPPDENGEVKPKNASQSKSQAGGKTAAAGGQTGKPQSDAQPSQETAQSASQGAANASKAGNTSTTDTQLVDLSPLGKELMSDINEALLEPESHPFVLDTQRVRLKAAFAEMFGGEFIGHKLVNWYLMNKAGVTPQNVAEVMTWQLLKDSLNWARNPENTSSLIEAAKAAQVKG